MYQIRVTTPSGIDEIDETMECTREEMLLQVAQYMADYGEPYGYTVSVTPLI